MICLTVLVLVAGRGDYRPSAMELALKPYGYSLVKWELSNFLDKWVRQAGFLLPWRSKVSRAERNDLVGEFFDLGRDQKDLARRLRFPDNAGRQRATKDLESLRAEAAAIEQRRQAILPRVEEAIESEVSAILAQEGFASRIGLIFPPVDTVFSSSPSVLVLSPRDRIHRNRTVLLMPGITDEEREGIEELIFQQENLAALVADTGGVATYPSLVSDAGSQHHAVVITAHEWLHHWFFFQPLGQHFWDSGDMTTLNETAATQGGQEIGDLAFTAMTGQRVTRQAEPPPRPGSDAFDFNRAMRETRQQTEVLLAQGRIEEAEAYMEERRQLMVANGHVIRKINQAFFAFHGSYADSPASISPINEQLKELRRRSDSLQGFLESVASFSSYEEFLEGLERALTE
ncbi:MAG: hypothetical protein BZY88_13720 [SAR202 cluster bacterium Io17-Chloro-G9]|nr:MAG: hypothetical protein BZY88_13720 [SAR202 cluster bacterium Io17-Chloro-G9]